MSLSSFWSTVFFFCVCVCFIKLTTKLTVKSSRRSLASPPDHTEVFFTSLVLLSLVCSPPLSSSLWIERESWQSKTKCPCVVSKAIVPADCGCCVLLAFLFILFFFCFSFFQCSSHGKDIQVCSRTLSSFPLLLSCLLCVSLRAYLTCCVLKNNSTAGSTGSSGSMELHSRHGSQ